MMDPNIRQTNQLSTRWESRGEEVMNSIHIIQMDLLKLVEHMNDIVNTCELIDKWSQVEYYRYRYHSIS